MRKIIAIILLFSTLSLHSQEKKPEPYSDDEFPQILLDVRRSSIILCGAYPLGYLYSSLAWDTIYSETDMYEDLDDDEKSNKEIETKLLSALVFAAAVMIIDLIIEKLFKGN